MNRHSPAILPGFPQRHPLQRLGVGSCLLAALAVLYLPAHFSFWQLMIGLLLSLFLIFFFIRRLHFWRNMAFLLGLGLALGPPVTDLYVLFLRGLGAHAYLSPPSHFVQTNSVLQFSFQLGLSFVLALVAGWMLHPRLPAAPLRGQIRWRISWLVWLALIIIWFLSLLNYSEFMGGTIFNTLYQSGHNYAFLQTRVSTVIANLCLVLLFNCGWPFAGMTRRLIIFILSLFTIFILLIYGNRVDTMFFLVAILISFVPDFSMQLKVMVLGLLILIPFFTFIAVFRLSEAQGLSLHTMAQSARKKMLNLPKIGDLGDVTLTTACAIYGMRANLIQSMHGISYLNYFPRTLPKFIYKTRPQSDERIFDEVGLMTNGGLTPVAQAYMNFQNWGPMLMGFFMGWLFGWLYTLSAKRNDTLGFCFYILLAASTMRVYFYELFDFYKMAIVFGILVFAVIWGNRLTGMPGGISQENIGRPYFAGSVPVHPSQSV